MIECRHIQERPHCFTHLDRNWPIYFAGKISKNRLVCKNAVALAYYGSCRLLVMGSCWKWVPLALQKPFPLMIMIMRTTTTTITITITITIINNNWMRFLWYPDNQGNEVKCNTRANSLSGCITRNHSIAQITRNHSGAHLAAKTLLASENSASFIMSKLCTALKCQLSANLNVLS